MTVLLLAAWFWGLSGVVGTIVTFPNLLASWFGFKYWRCHPEKGTAPLISAWGRLRLHLILFAFCLIFFGLGFLRVFVNPLTPLVTTLTLVGLSLLPALLIFLALTIASDERHIVTDRLE